LNSLPKYFLTLLIEHPLRLCALIAQVRSGLWVYNGGSIVTQVMLYHKNSCCYDDLYDFDILLLQSVSILMGGFSFSAITLNRFQIQPLMLENFKDMRTESLAMLDEYFQFIIIIIMQRSKTGHSEDMQILHDLIHRLCLEDHTYSQLENFLCTRLSSSSKFESLLKSIAIYHSASGYSEGKKSNLIFIKL
jgi:E3 ubiquitin-protein ligase UBR1